MKVRELLSGPEKWCQGALALSDFGEPVGPCHPRAAKWCLEGALYPCHDTLSIMAMRELIRVAVGCPLHEWNDAPGRTFEEVKALVEKLDI